MPRSVLVVDDDLSIREMVCAILAREGFEAGMAASGTEAIRRLDEQWFDAMVLDIMMEDGSGHDVLRVLSQQRPRVKCVVVISATSIANLERLDPANIAVKLRKPFDIHELLDAIAACVGSADASDGTATM